VAELAALEMLCTGNCTVGSNPTLSAKVEGKGQSARDEEQGLLYLSVLFALCP
jgi:hypothetical protein